MVPATDGPPLTGSATEAVRAPDLSADGWWAAERRRAVTTGPPEAAGVGPAAPAGLVGAGVGPAVAKAPAWQRRQRWLRLSRLWALVKMASLAYTTWWALGYLHARAGAALCAYGGVCLFAGVGGRWRKRFFGPGQLLEPELYADIGGWLYRIGTVLVLAGGALVVVQTVRH